MERTVTEVSGVWPDEIDEAILAQLRDVHALLDGPPADLDDQVLFAIAAAGLGAEIARIEDEQLVGSGARGTERTRTVSFDADSLTIMVTITDVPDDRIRIDGWLAPGGRWRVELRRRMERPDAAESSTSVTADDSGRFVFPAVRHGPAQFVVHRRPGGTDPGSTVVTPSVRL
jgi:hypothetical protein